MKSREVLSSVKMMAWVAAALCCWDWALAGGCGPCGGNKGAGLGLRRWVRGLLWVRGPEEPFSGKAKAHANKQALRK